MNNVDTKCLNSLKFIAACIIAFFWHYQHFSTYGQYPLSKIFEWSYNHGYLMVELFFMLSGFGMFLGYADKISSHQILFNEYILKRLKKIYPLFLFSLLMITLLESWHIFLTGKTFICNDLDLWHFFLNIILCQKGIFDLDKTFNASSWFLCVCFFLYILFFIILHHTKNKKNSIYIFIGVFFTGVFILVQKIEMPFLFNSYFARGLSSFSIGVILAYIFQKHKDINTKLIGYISLLLLIIYFLTYRSDVTLLGNNMTLFFIMFVSPAIILSVIYIPIINKILSLKPMNFLGSLSFEIYLLHFLIQCLFRDIELTFNFDSQYSQPYYLLIYFASVIIISVIYKKFLSKGVNKTLNVVVKHFIKDKSQTISIN